MRDRRLGLILALALLAGLMAYQAPPASGIAVGWLGDRLFLRGSDGQGAADQTSFYGDELDAQARGGRSRWTRADATVVLPGLGAGGALTLTLRARGWPDDVLGATVRQPTVMVTAGGAPIGSFTPTSEWADYQLSIPAAAQAAAQLTLALHASDTFTSTAAYVDPRPKGIRLEYIGVQGAGAPLTIPAPLPLGLLALDGALGLLALGAATRRPSLAFVLTTLLVSGAAIGLALARVWAVALLPWLTAGLALLLLLAHRAAVARLLDRLARRYRRGAALSYGLVALALAWLVYVIARASFTYQLPGLNAFRDSFPDSLLYGLLGMSVLLLLLVRGRDGLPRIAHAIVRFAGGRRGALALLLLFAAIWIGYETYVIARLPYVGHADYADNAVVARNLVAGRGWVVDYVTQFYQLYDGVTRPQETWPLLQPVWVAPFLALFGTDAWAAKIPNLLFTAALAALIYRVGARVWDRRVGLTAAVITLTSYLFFTLVIYVTSDLAFTLFSFGAIALLYRVTDERRTTNDERPAPRERPASPASDKPGAIHHGDHGDHGEKRGTGHGRGRSQSYYPDSPSPISHPPSPSRWWLVVGAGALTGLMLLQKPASGGLIALGMGLWYLAQSWRAGRAAWRAAPIRPPVVRALAAGLLPIATWALIALLILSPYLVRNVRLFGTPFYSTESRDAWVIEYTQVWDTIYKVYTPAADPRADGAPDRSWVLRWGFDRSLVKLGRQVEALREYLLPPWEGLPLNLSGLSIGKEDLSPLLFDTGAWLALLGALAALWSRRRLATLLLACFGPYVLFLLTYWHANEERYFVMIMPWLALLASYALWRGYDRIAAIGDGRWAPVGLALAITAIVLIVQPSWPRIDDKVQLEPQLYAADIDAYTWLRTHSAPDEVAMTRNPWQLNWQSQRPALMVPYTTDPQVFLRLARHYHVRYLVLDSLQRPRLEVRQMLDALLADPALGFEKVYTTPPYATYKGELTTEIYRFPASYGGVAELLP